MTASTDTRFEILHALRVKGLATDPVLSALSGVPVDRLSDALTDLVEKGLVTRRSGRFAGSTLTAAGKAQHATDLAADPATRRGRDRLEEFYTAFLPINGDFKRVCQAWQMRADDQPNDHTDAAYDRGVVEQLGDVDARLRPELSAVSAALPRFGRYEGRLGAALERVRGGDAASFARPMYDSYHDIWMELHQDLLLSLGRERGQHDEG